MVLLILLLRKIQLLRYDRPTIHPVQSYQQGWVDLGHLGCLDELALHVGEVGLLVVGDGPDVLEELAELRRKYVWREEFLRFDLILVLHHLL